MSDQDPRTWKDLAIAAGFSSELADYALWNLSAFPFTGPRETYYQLRHSKRLSERAGRWNEAPDGGFR